MSLTVVDKPESSDELFIKHQLQLDTSQEHQRKMGCILQAQSLLPAQTKFLKCKPPIKVKKSS